MDEYHDADADDPGGAERGQSGSNVATAAAAPDAAGPYQIFANSFLDTLLP